MNIRCWTWISAGFCRSLFATMNLPQQLNSPKQVSEKGFSIRGLYTVSTAVCRKTLPLSLKKWAGVQTALQLIISLICLPISQKWASNYYTYKPHLCGSVNYICKVMWNIRVSMCREKKKKKALRFERLMRRGPASSSRIRRMFRAQGSTHQSLGDSFATLVRVNIWWHMQSQTGQGQPLGGELKLLSSWDKVQETQ